MKFYKPEEVPVLSDDRVFKMSPVGKSIPLVLLSGLVITALVFAIRGEKLTGHGVPTVFCYVMAAFFGLFAWMAYRMFRASLQPSNWLMRGNSGGIILKYRSYLNWRLPEESVQAVGFDYAEIAWVRMVKERRTSPSMGQNSGTETVYMTFLDIGLANTDTSALEEHLQAERSVRPDGGAVWLDYPVQVLPGGVIEVKWSGGIHPRAGKAIEYFSQHVKIAAAESRKVDLTHDRKAPPEAELAKITALVNNGDEIAAAKLLQQSCGYSLSEAMGYVEKLRSGDEAKTD